MIARNLLLAGGSWNSQCAGPEGGKEGGGPFRKTKAGIRPSMSLGSAPLLVDALVGSAMGYSCCVSDPNNSGAKTVNDYFRKILVDLNLYLVGREFQFAPFPRLEFEKESSRISYRAISDSAH